MQKRLKNLMIKLGSTTIGKSDYYENKELCFAINKYNNCKVNL